MDKTIRQKSVKPMLEVTADEFNDTMTVSAFSLISLSHALLKSKVLQNGSSIVTLSYIAAEKVSFFPYINMSIAKAALERITIELADELGIGKENILSTLLKMPDVVSSTNEVLSEDEKAAIFGLLKQAIDLLNIHRQEEGKSIELDLLERVAGIEAQQAAIAVLEPNRRTKIKDGLIKLLEQNVGPDKYDNNRLEQELIYYIEKIDISEERVRLTNHCAYFKSILAEKDPNKGKKLSFVLQEMGREINTTGSKANDVDIQKAVIVMKDELEKAKEQILNVL